MKKYESGGNIEDGFIYDEKLFNPYESPKLIYKPSKVVMRKLLRVCASCSDIFDLYFLL